MTETTDDVGDARRARHQAIRAEVAQNESEAADADIAEQPVQAPCEQLIEDDVGSIARRVAHAELDRAYIPRTPPGGSARVMPTPA